MKPNVLLCLLIILAHPVFGGELNPDEVKQLLARASQLKEAYDKGDTKKLMEMTHPSIHALANGKEEFEKMTAAAMEQVRSMGITILESSLGEPTKTYASGSDTVCFVPKFSVMSAQGRKFKSIGFLIAIRNGNGNDWLFLDGAVFRKNPELLQVLLPGLPKRVKFPENRIEEVN
jgi:hypothetical protein